MTRRTAWPLGLFLWLAGCAAAGTPGVTLTAVEHNDLGVAHFQAGDARRAAGEFERALTRAPGWPRALVNLGDARLAQGDVRGAIDAYEGAVTAAPDDLAAANNLAWALLQDAERWREAEPVIRRALAGGPEPRGYYLDTLGVALLRRGDAAAALDAFRAALTDRALLPGPTRALVLEHAAEAYARTGDATAASHCLDLARREREVHPASGSLASARETGGVGEVGSVC